MSAHFHLRKQQMNDVNLVPHSYHEWTVLIENLNIPRIENINFYELPKYVRNHRKKSTKIEYNKPSQELCVRKLDHKNHPSIMVHHATRRQIGHGLLSRAHTAKTTVTIFFFVSIQFTHERRIQRHTR